VLEPISGPQIRTKVIDLTGGVNESVSTLNLKPGELISCLNYIEVDGEYSGYGSIWGFEAFDGTALPSSVDIVVNSDGTIDDTDREARRAAILAPDGTGACRGIHVYNGGVYALRDEISTEDNGILHKATSSGWEALTMPTGAVKKGGYGIFLDGKLSLFPSTAPHSICFFGVDGKSKPFASDGTTVWDLSDVNLPCDDAFTPAPIYPHLCIIFDNRLWLAFPGGYLFCCAIGDPTDWSGASGADNWPLGDEIEGLSLGPGNTLIVHLKNSTRIFKPTPASATYQYENESLLPEVGSFFNSSKVLLDDVIFLTKRGPTTLAASDKFGDFKASTITQKISKTFASRRKTVTCTFVKKELNQFFIMFEGGYGICMSFTDAVSSGGQPYSKLKGSSLIKYSKSIIHVAEGEDADGNTTRYMSADELSGMVYKMDSGTSFDGDVIPTRFVTAYWHYGFPRNWKQWIKLTFEATAESGTILKMRCSYDYKNIDSPKADEFTPKIGPKGGGVWGQSKWKLFKWGSSVVQTPEAFALGLGYNMSLTVSTSEKYRTPHIFHNIISDYILLGRKT
jgi:hypothetical protein